MAVTPVRPAATPPFLLARDQLYDELHSRLDNPPRRLTQIERDTLAQAAAHASARSVALPFHVRPGLVTEMLRFYDQLRRQSQRVDRFEELMAGSIGNETDDRGVERLLSQTRFLANAFRAYEEQAFRLGAHDEHMLRERLLADGARNPLRHIVVTVGDWIAEPGGLFPADFDLLTRLPGLKALDVVCTEAVLRSGFHERVHRWLPGIEESSADEAGRLPFSLPWLVCPPPDEGSAVAWFTHRDREEELYAVVRRLKDEDREENALDRTAVIFKRPLPYLYLAPDTLGAAGISYQVSDALPLAAEPVAAAVDLVIDALETNFSRSSVIALLRSSHLHFVDDEPTVTAEAIGALDRTLSELRYLGDASRLQRLTELWPENRTATEAMPALVVARAAVRRLMGLLEPAPAAESLERLVVVLEERLRPLDDRDPFAPRERRARSAIIQLLRNLSAAHAAHHNPSWSLEDLAAAVRRWLGEATFLVETGRSGVHLLDDQAARYGTYEDITIVGLVEKEWPDEPRRNVFYSSALLKALGWPTEKDRRSAANAHFVDLLTSATGTVVLSTFTLDDDAPVTRSLQLDEVPRAGLPTRILEGLVSRAGDDTHPFRPSGAGAELSNASYSFDGIAEREGPWAAMRASRPSAAFPEFHGQIGRQTKRPWSVSALETYLGCPFRFFAQHVLRLEEEPVDEEVMDPRRRGRLVHAVFEDFFRTWQKAGKGQIAQENLDAARRMLGEIVERSLAELSEAEAGLERARLLGSSAAAGLGEAVFRMEAERPVPVVERLLEHSLSGRFMMATTGGPREIELRGKADRLDLLADGTFRVVDYKLGWPPDRNRALQLPIYGLCAEQRLASERAGRWTLGEAVYIAFGGPRRVVPLFTSDEDRAGVLEAAQQRLVDAIDAIERGEFPPSPDDVFRCETCSFAAVCRKDYVGDV
jgi:RecB family exonuclease